MALFLLFCKGNGLYRLGLRAEIFCLDWSKREDPKTRLSNLDDKPYSTILTMFAYGAPCILESDLRYGENLLRANSL